MNVRCSLTFMSAILETTPSDIILIQEPPWSPLIPLWSDMDPEGSKIYGMTLHRDWKVFYLVHRMECPRVRMYVRLRVAAQYIITALPDLQSHVIMGLTFQPFLPTGDGATVFSLMSFYNHVE
jgi:hypothetical protein